MKTLIAALALTLATSSAAFAGYVDPKDGGAPLAADRAGYEVLQVSGFTGVGNGNFMGYVDAKDGGAPLTIGGENARTRVSGFTGIAANGAFSGYVDAKDGGLPLIQ